jgi:hypothetical protein
VNRIIHDLVPLLAEVLTPDNSNESRAWIIDTLIAVHDQSITAISETYRRSGDAINHALRIMPDSGTSRLQ